MNHKTVTVETDWELFDAQLTANMDVIFPLLALATAALPYSIAALVAAGEAIEESTIYKMNSFLRGRKVDIKRKGIWYWHIQCS